MAASAANALADVQKDREANGKIDWSKLVPKHVDKVKVMDPVKAKKAWEKIYDMAGLRNPSGDTRAACRIGVYLYLYRNGTSRVGEYSGNIVMSDGHSFDASVIVRAVGKMDVRRFMRANAAESYHALKSSGAVEMSPQDVAIAAKFGVRASQAVCLADWLDITDVLDPTERDLHDAIYNYRLKRAGASRGDRTLEEVEESHMEASVNAQSHGHGDGGKRDAVF